MENAGPAVVKIQKKNWLHGFRRIEWFKIILFADKLLNSWLGIA